MQTEPYLIFANKIRKKTVQNQERILQSTLVKSDAKAKHAQPDHKRKWRKHKLTIRLLTSPTALVYEQNTMVQDDTTQQHQLGVPKHPQEEKAMKDVIGHFPIYHDIRINSVGNNKPAPSLQDSIEGTFLWAVGVFGTVGNGAIVLTALCSRRMRSALHILIGTLAITDLFVSLVYIPSYTYFILQSQSEDILNKIQKAERDAGYTFCSISRNVFIEMASVTLTIKALIALNLYALTCSRDRASQIFSVRRTILYIILGWVINFAVLFMPDILGYAAVDFYPDHLICGSDGSVWKAINGKDSKLPVQSGKTTQIYSLIALAIHCIELGVILVCFLKVHRAISRGKSVYWQNQSDNAKQAKLHYSNATATTCLVFTTFCLCWLPIYIVNIVDPTRQFIPRSIHHLSMDLLLLKSAINPAIYIHGFRTVRHEMKLLCMCKCKGSVHQDVNVVAHYTSSVFSPEDEQSIHTSCVQVHL